MTERSTTNESVRHAAYQAAATAVDRFLDRLGDDAEGLTGPPTRRRMRAELAKVVDLNLDAIRHAFDLYGSWMDSGPGHTESGLELPAAFLGGTASTVVWLHNTSDEDRTDVRLVGSPLGTDGPSPIPASAWVFDPDRVTVPAHSAVPIGATVTIGETHQPGRYAGQLAATGLDGEPLPVSIHLLDRTPLGHDTW